MLSFQRNFRFRRKITGNFLFFRRKRVPKTFFPRKIFIPAEIFSVVKLLNGNKCYSGSIFPEIRKI